MAEILIFNWSTRPAAALSFADSPIPIGYEPWEEEIDADLARAIAAPLQVHNALELAMNYLTLQDREYVLAFEQKIALAFLINLNTLPSVLEHEHPHFAEIFACQGYNPHLEIPSPTMIFEAQSGLSGAAYYLDDIVKRPKIQVSENQRNIFIACLDIVRWSWQEGKTSSDQVFRLDQYGRMV